MTRARTVAFDVFQRQFLDSNVGPLRASLLSTLQEHPASQLVTALTTADLALSYIASTISTDRTATRTAARTVDDLRHAAEQGGSRAQNSSVVNRGISGGTVEGDVQYEMDQARRDLEEGFRNGWAWLSLLCKLGVDDVGSEVSLYLDRRFGRELERRVRTRQLVVARS